MQHCLAPRKALAVRPNSRVCRQQRARGGALLVRSVLDIPKPTTGDSNGAASKAEVSALESDIEHELKYRLAAASTDDQKLYQSGGARAAQDGRPWARQAEVTNPQGCMRRLPPLPPPPPTASVAASPRACSGLERAQPPGGCVRQDPAVLEVSSAG